MTRFIKAMEFIDDELVLEAESFPKRKKNTALKIAAMAACIAIAVLFSPTVYFMFNGAESADEKLEIRNDSISITECPDIIISNLDFSNFNSYNTNISFDEGGRNNQNAWNTLSFNANINQSYEYENIEILVYFPNYFQESSNADDNNMKNQGIYDYYSINNTTMEINGILVEYSDLSSDEKFLPKVPISDEEFEKASDDVKSMHTKFYTAKFEYKGNIYVVSIRTRYRENPLEYYIAQLIPENKGDTQ